MKKVIYTTLLIFLLILLKSKLIISAGQLQIEIWSDKTEYLTREPILVKYAIKNISDTTVVMIFDAVNEYFVIKDQEGRGYANMLSVSYAYRSDTLEPNETHVDSSGIDARYRIVSPGKYTCYIEVPANFVYPFCTEVSKSNVIIIKVKKPTGDEKKALDILLEADKLKHARDEEGKKDLAKRELGFQKYQDLVDKYPNSIYAPLSLNSATGIYKFSINLEERRKIIPVCRKLIENYPNSLYFNSAFMSLVDVYEILKDKEGAIKTMNELIEKHPDTKISEEAGKRLKRIEEWKF